MATLHIDFQFGLSVEKTRNQLGKYSRGVALESFVRHMPKVEFESQEEKYFDASQSSTLVFLSDFFGTEKPFDIKLFMQDESVTTFTDCNMLLIECSNVKAIKILNKSKETMRAHIIL